MAKLRNGCDTIIHTVGNRLHQCAVDDEDDKFLLTLDLESAFNQVDRSCFLEDIIRVTSLGSLV